LLDEDPNSARVAEYFVAKPSFRDWWSERSKDLGLEARAVDTVWRSEGATALTEVLTPRGSGSCPADDTWDNRPFEDIPIETAQHAAVPGVATGLAWTPVGGDILFIEASKVPGSGKLILTGQLGDVMKESAQAALTLAKTWCGDALEKTDIHVHVPAGATPKDGPSAGVAMFLALTSLLQGKPIRPDVAMTGEISLRGLVLPIGGVKEKTLAALRAGIRTVMLPRRNEKDLEDVPAEARAKLEFVFLDRVEDAIRTAIGELPSDRMAA